VLAVSRIHCVQDAFDPGHSFSAFPVHLALLASDLHLVHLALLASDLHLRLFSVAFAFAMTHNTSLQGNCPPWLQLLTLHCHCSCQPRNCLLIWHYRLLVHTCRDLSSFLLLLPYSASCSDTLPHSWADLLYPLLHLLCSQWQIDPSTFCSNGSCLNAVQAAASVRPGSFEQHGTSENLDLTVDSASPGFSECMSWCSTQKPTDWCSQ